MRIFEVLDSFIPIQPKPTIIPKSHGGGIIVYEVSSDKNDQIKITISYSGNNLVDFRDEEIVRVEVKNGKIFYYSFDKVPEMTEWENFTTVDNLRVFFSMMASPYLQMAMEKRKDMRDNQTEAVDQEMTSINQSINSAFSQIEKLVEYYKNKQLAESNTNIQKSQDLS